MPFGLYNLASRLGLPDLGVSERTTGYTTRQPMVFPVGAGLQTRAPQVLGTSTSVLNTAAPFNQTPNYYQLPLSGSVSNPSPRAASSRIVSTPVSSPGRTAVPQVQSYKPTRSAPAYRPPDTSYIDENYAGTMDYLNRTRGSYEQDYNNILGGITSQFESLKPGLAAARTDLLNQNAADQQSVQQTALNAKAEAAQLLNELQQANRQRYGGSTGTGEFASELQGREYQGRQAQISDTMGANLLKLSQQAESINSSYENQLQQLELQKQEAMQNAQLQLSDRLRQLDSLRGQTEDAKAQSKNDLILKYKQDIQNINNSMAEFQNNISLDAINRINSLRDAQNEYRINLGQAPDLSGYPDFSFSSYGGSAQPYTPMPQAAGRPKYEEEVGPLNQIGFFSNEGEQYPIYQPNLVP